MTAGTTTTSLPGLAPKQPPRTPWMTSTGWNFLLLLFVTVPLSACRAAGATLVTEEAPPWATAHNVAARGWTLEDHDTDEDTGWLVYGRDDPETGLRVFRIVGPVNARPQATAAALRTRLTDTSLVEPGQTRTVLATTEDSVLIHTHASMPLFFNERETTERYTFEHDSAADVINVRGVEADSEGPPARAGVVRLPVMKTWLTLRPLPIGRTIVTFDTVFDMGGSLPSFLVHAGAREQMVRELELVRELAARGKNSDAALARSPSDR